MIVLAAFFGFFALLAAVALVRFQANPIFLFMFLLCAASLAWIVRIDREEKAGGTRRSARGSRPRPRKTSRR